ncbi:hypothetical protein SAY87_023724 [Trapa incisa]|uniref:tRNA/rRNA methyltransferase SpoU type domain-containing protein n=1 Tax=Trapa incisa TaxID=236973 RepID=A0AAN7L3Y6_9MYRT|nr:hypothetical protein SAY87_023724 [Trapa incisa]
MVVESYVVMHNIAKHHNNVGTFARSATAFGVSELIFVGRRDFNSFCSYGSLSVLARVFSLVPVLGISYELDCDICGVDITDGAVAVNENPFKRSTTFLLGNEAIMPNLVYRKRDALDVTSVVWNFMHGCNRELA